MVNCDGRIIDNTDKIRQYTGTFSSPCDAKTSHGGCRWASQRNSAYRWKFTLGDRVSFPDTGGTWLINDGYSEEGKSSDAVWRDVLKRPRFHQETRTQIICAECQLLCHLKHSPLFCIPTLYL